MYLSNVPVSIVVSDSPILFKVRKHNVYDPLFDTMTSLKLDCEGKVEGKRGLGQPGIKLSRPNRKESGSLVV